MKAQHTTDVQVNHRTDQVSEADLMCAMRDLIAAQNRYISLAQAFGTHNPVAAVQLPAGALAPPDVTFATAAEDFLERQRDCVRRTTYGTYCWNVQRKIIPEIGQIPVNQVSSKVVQGYINDMAQRGMSAHALRDNVSLIKLVVKDYAKQRDLPSPQFDVKYPKTQQKEDILERVLNAEEYAALYRYCTENSSGTGTAVLLGMVLGLRIGEVCGLRLSDVDFMEKRIKIVRSVKRVNTGNGSEIEVSEPKTASSVRTLPLPDVLAEVIKKRNLSENDYIISGRATPTEPRTLRQSYVRMLKRLQLRHHKFHDLRHTFASRAIASGADPRSVADLMGHTTVEMTLNTYTHTDDAQRRKVVQGAIFQSSAANQDT